MNSKSKNTLILFIALIVLIGVYLIWQSPFQSKANLIKTESLITTDLANVQKIEITKNQKSTILEKKDNIWQISSEDNKPANSALIDDLISSLKEINSGTIVTQSNDKLDKYGLADDQVTRLKLSDSQNNQIIEVLIGKIGGPAYTGTYLKKADSTNVLLIETNLTSKVDQTNWLAVEKPTEATNTNQPVNP